VIMVGGVNSILALSFAAVASGLLISPTVTVKRPALHRAARVSTLHGAAASSLVETPADTYHILVNKGVANSKLSWAKTLHASVMGGIQVGIGGLLCLTVCGNMPGVAATNPGLIKLLFGALFPVCLVLVLNSGTQLYTGNTATMASAWMEGKITKDDVAKSWILSFIGNIIGCGLMAWVAVYTGMLSGGTATMASAVGVAKCGGGSFMKMVVKGIFCNYLVCMAVFLATQARDMMGKYIGIWVPISTFVATGYEHSVANLFLLPAALAAGSPVTLRDVLLKNLLPVTIGNAIAGTVLIGASFSYAFGKLGGCAREDECEVGESGVDAKRVKAR